MILKVGEKQIIVAIKNLLARNGDTSIYDLESFGEMFFCSYKVEWKQVFETLLEKGIIYNEEGKFFINRQFDELASSLVRKYPRFRYWYNDWYKFAENSEAHSKLCSRAYGIDLCQTGMMTINQINYVTDSIIEDNKYCLDLGCGAGHITEYIAYLCFSDITGIDLTASGIRLARKRTKNKRNYIKFYRSNMIDYLPKNVKYDYILSFDAMYFAGDRMDQCIENSLKMLNDDGKLVVFYSAWNPKDDNLDVGSTVLGEYLNKQGISYDYVDFTDDDRLHWKLKYNALLDLKDMFINEGNETIFINRLKEAEYFTRLASEDKLFRYLYVIDKSY